MRRIFQEEEVFLKFMDEGCNNREETPSTKKMLSEGTTNNSADLTVSLQLMNVTADRLDWQADGRRCHLMPISIGFSHIAISLNMTD
jgi:hypothetical protein